MNSKQTTTNRDILMENFEFSFDKNYINSLCSSVVVDGNLNITVVFDTNDVLEFNKKTNKISYAKGDVSDFYSLANKINDCHDSVLTLDIDDYYSADNITISSTKSSPSTLNLFAENNVLNNYFFNSDILHKKSSNIFNDFYGFHESGNFCTIFIGKVSRYCDIEDKINVVLEKELSQSNYDINEIYQNSINQFDCKECDLELCFISFNKKNNELQLVGTGSTLIVANEEGNSNLYLSGKESAKLDVKTYSVFLNKKDKIIFFSDGINKQFIGNQNRKLGRRGVQEIIDDLGDVNIANFKKMFKILRGSNKQELDYTMFMLTV